MLRTNAYLAAYIFFSLIFINPSLSRADEKTDTVNQQLDTVEKEFSGAPRPDNAQKEFSHAPPEGQSAGPMLKELLDPDLSQNPQPKAPSDVTTRVHTLDMGPEFFYYRYEEPDLGVKIYGPMYGYYLDYAYRPASPHVLNNFLTNVYALQARYATSNELDYKGSGTVNDKYDYYMEFRGLIGKDYFVGPEVMVTPYFGFGYRYLKDHGNGELSSTNAYLYDRKSHYYYLPLGGDLVARMPHQWEIDFNLEYDIFLYGLQKSFLSDGDQFTGFNNPDITNDQNHGYGLRASIKFLKHCHAVDFYAEPYVRFWNIEDSSTATAVIDGTLLTGLEPKNNTTEVGSKFGIQF